MALPLLEARSPPTGGVRQVIAVEKQSIAIVVERDDLFGNEFIWRVQQSIVLLQFRFDLFVLHLLHQFGKIPCLNFDVTAYAQDLVERLHLPAQQHRALFKFDDLPLHGEVVHACENSSVLDRMQADSAQNVCGDEIGCAVAVGLVRMIEENVLHFVGPRAGRVGVAMNASAEFDIFVVGVETLQTLLDVRRETSESLARENDARTAHAEVLVLAERELAKFFLRSHAWLTDVVGFT